MVAYAFWGFFSAVAERHLPVMTAFAWHTVAIVAGAMLGIPFCGFTLPASQIGLSLLGGAGYAQGAVWMVDSISAGGPTGVVVTVTAMYPLAVLGMNLLFLQQLLSWQQCGGVVVAAASILCFMENDEADGAPAGRKSTAKWLGLCLLSLLGYATWTFAAEVCVAMPSDGISPTTVQGTRLIWQAVGCGAVCALHRPALRPQPPAELSPQARRRRSSSGTLGRVRSRSAASCSSRSSSSSFAAPLLDSGAAAEGGGSWSVGVLGALAMGLSAAVGSIGFLMAAKVAPADALPAVVMISGMYGGATVVLMRVFMGEQLSCRRIVGILLALLAGAFLA